MNTSPILNPAGIPASPLPKPQQAGGTAADRPFNQVLSREVAERRSAADTGKPGPKETAHANEPSQPPAAQNAKPVDEGKSAEAAEAAVAAVDPATAQMLALAAQFGQAHAIPAETPAAAEAPLADAPGRAAGIGKDGAADRILIPALPDPKQKTASIEKEALLQPSGFNARMEQAGERKQPLELSPDKARAGLSAIVQSTLELQAAKNQERQPGLSAATLAPLQQAVFDKTQALAGHPTEKLAPQVGATGWDQALGQKMIWMVAGAQQSASLTLNPPDLGPLQVVLNVSSGQATANFVAAQPEVRQALEAALPRLREMLGDAGIQLGQANVSAGTPNQHGSFGEQRQASRHVDHTGGATDAPLRATRSTLPVTRQGMVDTFA